MAIDKLELKSLKEYFDIENTIKYISIRELLELRNNDYENLVL